MSISKYNNLKYSKTKVVFTADVKKQIVEKITELELLGLFHEIDSILKQYEMSLEEFNSMRTKLNKLGKYALMTTRTRALRK